MGETVGETVGAPVVPEAATKLDELVAVMARLRAPGGCPWDADQTHESLVQYLIEETYELIDAIETARDQGELRTREEALARLSDLVDRRRASRG